MCHNTFIHQWMILVESSRHLVTIFERRVQKFLSIAIFFSCKYKRGQRKGGRGRREVERGGTGGQMETLAMDRDNWRSSCIVTGTTRHRGLSRQQLLLIDNHVTAN